MCHSGEVVYVGAGVDGIDIVSFKGDDVFVGVGVTVVGPLLLSIVLG